MAETPDKDDEHFAPESGDHEFEESAPQLVEPEHAKDDEHYAPES